MPGISVGLPLVLPCEGLTPNRVSSFDSATEGLVPLKQLEYFGQRHDSGQIPSVFNFVV